jgi:hypothetical protein
MCENTELVSAEASVFSLLTCTYIHSISFIPFILYNFQRYLRLAQHPELTIARRITRHEQPALRIPCQSCGPEAPRAKARPVTLTFLYLRIVKDVFGGSCAGNGINRRVLPISASLEAHSHKLEASNRRAVPRTMVRDVHGAGVGIELAVNRCGVGKEGHLGSNCLLVTGIVVEGAIGCWGEEIADFEGLVGEVGGLPNGEAGWVTIPVVVGLGDVPDVVDLLAWVVLVNVLGLTVDGALEIITTVLYTPEPIG